MEKKKKGNEVETRERMEAKERNIWWRQGDEKSAGKPEALLCLQKRALLLLALLGVFRREDGADSLVEDLHETLLSGGRALKVLDSADLGSLGLSLLLGDGRLVLLGELCDGVLVAAEIDLGADEDDGGGGAVVADLRDPLGAHVVERRGADDTEADEEDVGLGVRQGSETVVVLLAGGIPEAKVHRLAVHHKVGAVVVKHCRDVLAGERVCCETDQKASLSDRTITNCNTLDCLHPVVLAAEKEGGVMNRNMKTRWWVNIQTKTQR